MRKINTFIVAFCSLALLNAQDLAKKIPSSANVVVTVKGKNIIELVSLDEFSSSKIGAEITKEISRESKGEMNTLEDLGLNLDENFYYFLETKEGVFYNVFLIPFKDTSNMLKLLHRERDEIITEGEISYLQEEYGGIVAMWTTNKFMMVMPSEQNRDYYNDYSQYQYEEISPVKENMVEEAVEIQEDETIEKPQQSTYDYYQSDAYKKQEEERKANRDGARTANNKNTLEYAKQVLLGSPKSSVLQNAAYKKSLGKGKDEAMFWMNDFADIYKNALPTSLLGPSNPYEFLNLDELYKGMTITGRLNFEDDQAIMGLDYSMSESMAKIYKPMYDGKFNKNFFSYINEDKLLGYMNINLSTQGVLEAYPALIESMFSKNATTSDDKAETIAAAATSVTRLFSLLIDEEGAAKILRGDMLLLLSDLREKEVTYTDYEYDEDYNYKEVKRTKTETVPDFLFLFTSDEEKMFRNFMKIGVKENKVTYEGGIYSIPSSRSTPFDIYAMYFDNTVFFGTSVTHLTQIKNGTYKSKVSGQLQKDMSKNAMSFYINGKNIISEIPTEAFPRELSNNIEFLTNNTEDLKMNFSRIKGNKMKGEMILKTPKQGHKNSLVYFINMIDKLME